MSEEPLTPIFVNRLRELEEFDSLLRDLEHSRRRHLALLDLRRIGKTVLLDEVRRRHPSFPICYVALDDVVSSLETFTRSLMGQLLVSAARKKGLEPPLVRTEETLIQTAAALDRQGKIGFAVAGSKTTALRKLIGASNPPLFTRFNSVPMDPFGLEAATELATTV